MGSEGERVHLGIFDDPNSAVAGSDGNTSAVGRLCDMVEDDDTGATAAMRVSIAQGYQLLGVLLNYNLMLTCRFNFILYPQLLCWCEHIESGTVDAGDLAGDSTGEEGEGKVDGKVEYNMDILMMIQTNLQRLEALKGEWSDHTHRMAPTEPSATRFRDWAQDRYIEVDDVSIDSSSSVACRMSIALLISLPLPSLPPVTPPPPPPSWPP
jgi:hypothetical protein